MSPTEAQLRAALREGAGRGLDADAIIEKAERYRRARRQRRTNLALAAGVVVAFAGIGGGLIALNGSDSEQGGSSGGVAAAPADTSRRSAPADTSRRAVSGAAGGAGSSVTSAPSPGYGGSTLVVSCPDRAEPVPATAYGRPLPAGQLLPVHLSRITACGYAMGRIQHRAVLHGAVADGVAAKLNNAPARPVEATSGCASRAQPSRRLLLLSTATDGDIAKTVVITVRCAQVVATNGTVTRYLPDLPRPLSPLMR